MTHELPKLTLLQEVQQALLALLQPLTGPELAEQYHPDLSPLGWHVGHCVFIENLWIEHQVTPTAAALENLYLPQLSPKTERGKRLPRKAELLDWAERQQRRHIGLLSRGFLDKDAWPLLRGEALIDFLLQHHSQHLETMRMALAQRAARQCLHGFEGAQLQAQWPSNEVVDLPAGEYAIGCSQPGAYDNEQPQRCLRLRRMRLGKRPVSNAEYLAFMEDGGYRRQALWSDAGWRWRAGLSQAQPEHWRQDAAGGWLRLTPSGALPLPADDSLIGISYFEAEAYATWAGGRLPHEYEWEAAAAHGSLQSVGSAWEWCSNRFHPYPSFRAFPYERYSVPWFDGEHRVLRGGSPYTQPCLRRATFRNFYTADKRHIFAGCRLAFDG